MANEENVIVHDQATQTNCVGLAEARSDIRNLINWQISQNGTLKAINEKVDKALEKVDKALLWLLGVFAMLVLTLIGVIIDIAIRK